MGEFRMSIEVYADTANIDEIIKLNQDDRIRGFTTNPTLMKKANVKNYKEFAKKVLEHVDKKVISFEVLSNDFNEMTKEAEIISSWGENIYVKIPIVYADGETTVDLLRYLSKSGIKINVTGLFTLNQVYLASELIKNNCDCIFSIFAGRIADTLIDPVPIMVQAKNLIRKYKNQKLLWASSREIYNLKIAEESGADIITLSTDLIKKFELRNKDLTVFSVETIQQFYNDGVDSNFRI